MNTVNKTQLMNLLAQEIGVGADDIRERRLRTLILIGKGMFWTGGYDKAAERLAADIQAEFDGIYHVGVEDEDELMRTDYPYNWTPRPASFSVTEQEKVLEKGEEKEKLIWIGAVCYDWNDLDGVCELQETIAKRVRELFKLLPKLENE